MRLEGADGAFGDVTTMDIRGNKLELLSPLLLDAELVACAAFVVNDLEVDTVAALCEAGHYTICGSKAVSVVAGFECLHQDAIDVHMVGEHDEVVSASGVNREPAHFISVKLADGFSRNVELL